MLPLSAAARLVLSLLSSLPEPEVERCDLDLASMASVAACALAQSPDIARAKHEVDAVTGRRETASVVLPSQPVLAAGAGQRRTLSGPSSAPTWEVSLSQEVEIGFQRGARIDTADAELNAAARRLALTRQEVAAQALNAYVDVLAAKEEMALAAQVGEVVSSLGDLARARVEEALSAPVEADAALSEIARLALVRANAERHYGDAAATLALMLGRELTETLDLPSSMDTVVTAVGVEERGLADLIAHAVAVRGDLAAAEAERVAAEGQLSLMRRERVPNITLSVFGARDGFDERVIGAGLSLPLPLLPSPAGPSRAGEIVELTARLDQADDDMRSVRRRVQLEVARAHASAKASQTALQSLSPDLLQRARQELPLLREAVGAGQLSLAQAVVMQRGLIDLILAHVELRRAHVLAALELRRAAALPLPGVEP